MGESARYRKLPGQGGCIAEPEVGYRRPDIVGAAVPIHLQRVETPPRLNGCQTAGVARW